MDIRSETDPAAPQAAGAGGTCCERHNQAGWDNKTGKIEGCLTMLSGWLFVLTEQGFPVAWKEGRSGIDVVEHTDGSGVSFVVVVLLELVFGDAFGDRGVYEGVVADENADVADAVAAGLEEDEIAGFELAALDLLPETCHFLGCAGSFILKTLSYMKRTKPEQSKPAAVCPPNRYLMPKNCFTSLKKRLIEHAFFRVLSARLKGLTIDRQEWRKA